MCAQLDNRDNSETEHINYCNEYEIRCKKVKELEKIGKSAWPEALTKLVSLKSIHELDPELYHTEYLIAGRLRGKREHGKSIFLTIEDYTGTLQLYGKKGEVGDKEMEFIEHFCDIGDYIWASGTVFVTKMGEITLRINLIGILSKCLRPIPNSFTGFKDVEMRYRQRYVDLLVHKEVRETFKKRSFIVREVRKYFDSHDFLEVETPMLHPIPGGATAKPFVTHHNALDVDFFLKIAPELYLKRLIVGGLERVYDMNKLFRNEGLSMRHNPEFTTIEYYMAHQDYKFLMNFTEKCIQTVLMNVCGTLTLPFRDHVIDFSKTFERINPLDSVVKYAEISKDELSEKNIDSTLKKKGITDFEQKSYHEKVFLLFEAFVEKKLIQPTFIIDYPIEISPLAKRDPQNPNIASRFELFIGGMEIANGFNELNDPFDQAQRFLEQVKLHDAGDDEAMYYDADYINALEYGMPPTVGAAIGIDRLCMFATNSATIKDVILFPAMKPNPELNE